MIKLPKVIFLSLFFLSVSAFSQELSKSNKSYINYSMTDSQSYQRSPYSRMMFRVGKIDLTGRYSVENLESLITTTVSDIEQKGWELSIVGGVDTRTGFDFRPMITFQWFDITKSGNNMASNMMLLGEFEFAYNLNQYFSSFIGFNAGVGITDFKDQETDAGYGAQFSFFIGLSGEVYKQLGYYTKLSATKKTSYFTYKDVNKYMSSNLVSIKYGLSYKF